LTDLTTELEACVSSVDDHAVTNVEAAKEVRDVESNENVSVAMLEAL